MLYESPVAQTMSEQLFELHADNSITINYLLRPTSLGGNFITALPAPSAAIKIDKTKLRAVYCDSGQSSIRWRAYGPPLV